MKRFFAAFVCGCVLLGPVVGCGDRPPPARKKTKHGDHWHEEGEKHDDEKEKSEKPKSDAPKPGADAKKPE